MIASLAEEIKFVIKLQKKQNKKNVSYQFWILTAHVTVSCPKEFQTHVLNIPCATWVKKNSKFYKEQVNLLALLSSVNFEVFESQLLLEYHTQKSQKAH